MRFQSVTMIVLIATAAVALAGCADARFERASQKRLARIDNLLSRAQQRESEAPERLSATQEMAVEAIDRHRDWLQNDLVFLNRSVSREVDRWPGRWARTVAFTRDYLDGDLASADETIARLLYQTPDSVR